MRIEELRIGNLVKNKEIICYVSSLDSDADEVKIYPNAIPNDTIVSINNILASSIQAIPLSENILVKCGFKETQFWKDSPTYYVLGNFVLEINYYEHTFYFDDTKIEYVHQLQNIYFALTKTELKIEL